MTIKEIFHKYYHVCFYILCLTALMVGLMIRTQNLGSLRPFEADERLWLLVGTSLLQKGIPASWTLYWEKYPHTESIVYGGQNSLVVTPFLDHPPLFGIGMGLWAAITGNNTALPLNWAMLRLPMIVLALGTIVCTSLFIHRLFHFSFASITLIAFSFFPAHIIASRFIVAENIIAFLLAASLYAFAIVDTEKHRASNKAVVALAVIVLVCSMAILFKLSAIVIPASIGFIALLRKNWHVFIGTTMATVFSVLVLILYGAYYDWSIFLDVFSGHTGRTQSFWHFWSIFTQMDLGYFPMRDPSFIVGSIGIFTLMDNRDIPWKKRLFIFSPLLNFSLLFLFVAPVESYGWYKFALFPLLAIGLGYVFTELARGKVIYYALLLPFIAIMMEHSTLIESHEHRKRIMLLLYGWVVTAIILKQYVPKTKILLPISFSALACLLFLLELTWVNALIP